MTAAPCEAAAACSVDSPPGNLLCSPADERTFDTEARTARFHRTHVRGIQAALRPELGEPFAVLETDRCPFVNLPENRRYRWGLGLTKEDMENCRRLRPKFVAQIELTASTLTVICGIRVFAGLRDDKDPRLIVPLNSPHWPATTTKQQWLRRRLKPIRPFMQYIPSADQTPPHAAPASPHPRVLRYDP
jgi:hypothetical protein